ncbi:MAG TPA: hypothetical protein VGM50_14685, partial [Gemmatimonadaceae bacterium]
MRRTSAPRRFVALSAYAALGVGIGLAPAVLRGQSPTSSPATTQLHFAISFPQSRSAQPLDGRIILVISNNNRKEPRFENNVYQA